MKNILYTLIVSLVTVMLFGCSKNCTESESVISQVTRETENSHIQQEETQEMEGSITEQTSIETGLMVDETIIPESSIFEEIEPNDENSNDSVIGTWAQESEEVILYYSFNEDGTASIESFLPNGSNSLINVSFTYTIEGDSLRWIYEDQPDDVIPFVVDGDNLYLNGQSEPLIRMN